MKVFFGLILLSTIEFALATSPPIRTFRPVPLNAATKGVATQVLEQLKPFFGAGRVCQLQIDQVYEAKVYEGEETVYQFELKLSSGGPRCTPQSKTCSGIKVFIPAPQNCDDPRGQCYVLFKSEEINCIPEFIVEPLGPSGKTIQNPNNNPIIQDIGTQAIQFLYNKLGTSPTCPLYLKDIISVVETEKGNGLDFDFRVQVETNSADFSNCEYKVHECTHLKVFQPRDVSLCPTRRSCVIPMDLNGVNCVNINQVLF